MFRKWLNAAGLAVLFTIIALAMSQAGPLEPSAPPGPTMKTLDEIPPTWSLILPTAQRYVVVMNGAAVLDKETGLVWERTTGTTDSTWDSARLSCFANNRGQRSGWRLPSYPELSSVVGVNRRLDPLSPFDTECSDGACVDLTATYWSSTGAPSDPDQPLILNLGTGGRAQTAKTSTLRSLCVRGGSGDSSGQ